MKQCFADADYLYMRDVERLRKPMQRISDYLNRQMVGAVEVVEDVD